MRTVSWRCPANGKSNGRGNNETTRDQKGELCYPISNRPIVSCNSRDGEGSTRQLSLVKDILVKITDTNLEKSFQREKSISEMDNKNRV